ncbi:MAG: FlgO family outer membrane protein [Candidatus Marinimicrobia bacterium]|jgi:TolB-like protein|nr:FlgO family outer membrane protein [Candidatus Neomarinimicrobiota bacterium]|tara:strand:- start:386 stop:1261 length:876 start_codon:yes stop_codon:yes gene_type:complete
MKKIAIHTGFVVVLLSALNTVCFSQDTSVETSIVNSQIQQLVDDLLINVPDNDFGVAVLSFETTEGRTEARDLGEAAAILINQNLISIPNISVVERERLEDIIEEIGLSQTGLTSDEIEVGNILNVQYLIAGAVADLGNRFLLAARIINVETGNILQSASVEIPSNSFLSISSELVMIKKYPITAAFRSMIFPGWGQFYNDKPRKGSIILGSELLMAASTISSYVLYKQSKDAYDRSTQRDVASDNYSEMEKYAQINWVSMGVMGGIWLYAIVDSYIDARSQIKQFRSKKS